MSLLKDLSNIRQLEKCWKSVKRGKTKKIKAISGGIDKITLKTFEDNKAEYLAEISAELLSGVYKINKLKPHKKAKSQPNKFRLLGLPTIKDRIVQKALLEIIYPFFSDSINTGVSYCGIKKSINKETAGIKEAVSKFVAHVKCENFFVFESDIKSFFDKVSKRKLWNKIKKKLPDESLAPLIKSVIYFKMADLEKYAEDNRIEKPQKWIGIAQGSPLSPLFSNIYLYEFDNAMKKKFGDRFIRYVDDFIVVCKSHKEAKEAEALSTKILLKLNLHLAGIDKTHTLDIRKARVVFLGIAFNKEKISTKKAKDEILQWLRKELSQIHNYVWKGEMIPAKKAINIINSKVHGLFNFYKFYHTQNLFTEINKIITAKRREKTMYMGLKFVDLSLIKPEISEQEWRENFI